MSTSRRQQNSYEQATRQRYRDPAVARAYHEQFTSGLSWRTFPHVLVAHAEQRAVHLLLAEVAGVASALDVPCGTGKLLDVLERFSFAKVGGDISRSMMEIARAAARRIASPWEFAQLDVTRLPFEDRQFDLVICLRLLHRVPDTVKRDAIAELTRVSGRYLVLSYGITNLWHRARQALRRIISAENSIPYPLSRAAANSLIGRTGWRIIRRLHPLPVLSAEEMVLLAR